MRSLDFARDDTQCCSQGVIEKLQLSDFSYGLSCTDHIWNILFPNADKQWNHLNISRYRDTFYITHINGTGSLEVTPGMQVKATDFSGSSFGSMMSEDHWEHLIASAHKWLNAVRKDWLKANKRLQVEYPLYYRFGIAPQSLIYASLPDIYRPDGELGTKRTKALVALVEAGFFHKAEHTEAPTMTANNYFEYCRIAYIAGKKKGDKIDSSQSGREMYERYADGRHEGLLDINPTSEQEFADWLDGSHPKRTQGGHPWEIKRGGNTTHIDLSVMRPSHYQSSAFKVELRGESAGRIVETICMLLAIRKAGLPISIANPEGIRKRLLAQDNVGIVPSYAPLHRANQHFGRDQDVFDVMYYNDLGRYKRRITPFITWEPLPLLRPSILSQK